MNKCVYEYIGYIVKILYKLKENYELYFKFYVCFLDIFKIRIINIKWDGKE